MKHSRGTARKRVDVSTYMNKKGEHKVGILLSYERASAIAVDHNGEDVEFLLDVISETIEREEADRQDG